MKTLDEAFLRQQFEAQKEGFDASGENGYGARQKLEKFLKVRHVRTSAMPRMQALSSNQTLTQDGLSSKDRIPSSKVTGRNITLSPKQEQHMNADLNMVKHENNYNRFGNLQKVCQVIANVTGQTTFTTKDTKQKMELQVSSKQDMLLV